MLSITPFEKKIFWAGQRLEWWEEEHLKDPLVAPEKALECLEASHQCWHFVSEFVVASLCRRNGFQHRWVKDFAKDVGRGLLGRRMAFPESMGCCALAFMIRLLERPEEVRAAWRALFFLTKKEPFALTEAVQFKPFILAETLEGMCFDWLAPDDRRR